MRKLGILFGILLFVQFGCAAHWISGWTEDALDGEPRNGKSVLMWNPSVGVLDNRSDVIGIGGASGVSGIYMIDCEMLGVGCFVGDILSLKIFGERYVSWVVNVTVSGAGYDAPGNLSLNSPAWVDLVSPVDYSAGAVDFNCSFEDLDDNVARVELWGNRSGSWAEEDFVTSGFGDGYVVFSDSLVQGSYEWNCYVEDELGIGSWELANESFFVDTTSPIIAGVSSVTEVCGFGEIPVDCEVSDNVEIGSVVVRSVSPGNSMTNYSASLVSGNIYRANIDLDEVGDWGFECFAFDGVGNMDYYSGEVVEVGSGNAELSFFGGVGVDKSPEVEGEILNISVNVTNSGCVGSGVFLVGFFDGVDSFENLSVSIGARSSLNVSSLWSVDIGTSDIIVYADLDLEVDEDSELNNSVMTEVFLTAWQGIYGNVSLDLILAGGENMMGNWSGAASFAGNIFVADSEADIEWNNLQAVGRTKLGESSSGDFGEIDSGLGMGEYDDSIFGVYDGCEVDIFSVFGEDIVNVPVVNSSANFATGILWDMGDSLDGEYDSVESEDIVFVNRVNVGQEGSYGVYDYEILVPSKLRGYDSGDESKVYLYYDLN